MTEVPARKLTADHVAMAICDALGEIWDDISVDEAENFRALSLHAIPAYEELLEDQGFRKIPPGMMIKPRSDEEAKAMATAVREWLAQPEHARNRRKGLVSSARPQLILPPGATRQ